MDNAQLAARVAALETRLTESHLRVQALEYAHAALALSLLKILAIRFEWNDDELTSRLLDLAIDADGMEDQLEVPRARVASLLHNCALALAPYPMVRPEPG